MAVLAAVLERPALTPSEIGPDFWRGFGVEDLITLVVQAGKKGVLDAPRAGGWDLKRGVRTHRGSDGVRRYIPGWGPTDVPGDKLSFTTEPVKVDGVKPVIKKTKMVLGTIGADAHVMGINNIREAFEQAGFEVIFLRGMNLPETVAEIAVEAKADIIGVSNLLGMGTVLYPRVSARLEQLGQRDKIKVIAGGRVAEKEEEHSAMEEKMKREGTAFLAVDAFFGPGTLPEKVVEWVQKNIEEGHQ
jgi:2-methyleneglutarate mutase